MLVHKFRYNYAQQRVRQKSIQNLLGFFSSVSIMYPVLSTIIIIFYGAQEVNIGTLTVGALVGINVLNSRIYGPITRFSNYTNSLSLNNTIEFLRNNKNFIEYENYSGVTPKIFKGNNRARFNNRL